MLAQIVVTRGEAGWIVITFDATSVQERFVCSDKEQLMETLIRTINQLVQRELLKDKQVL